MKKTKKKKLKPRKTHQKYSKPKRKVRKIKKIKKLTSAERKKENLDQLSSGLIEKGRKRRFVTYDEILKTFPDIENNIFFLDELYEKLAAAGIDRKSKRLNSHHLLISFFILFL